MLWDLTNSWKAFPAPSGCGSIFPAKSCQDASRSGSWLARVRWVWQMRQNFVAQFVQLWVVVHVVGRCRENWALSLDRCQCCSFPCISSICCAFFSGVMVSRGFTKLQWIRGAAEHQTVTMTLYWCKFGFGKCFGASSWSNHWAGHRQLYKIYFSSHVTVQSRNGSLLLHRIREDDSFSKRRFLNFRSAHEAPTYGASSPFQFTSNVQQP